MKNIHWQIRLEHDRACRDALVQCGNPPPSKPDPPNGVRHITATKFNGKIFFSFLEQRGHTAGDIHQCKCSQKKEQSF